MNVLIQVVVAIVIREVIVRFGQFENFGTRIAAIWGDDYCG